MTSISSLIGEARFNRFHFRLLFWSCLIVTFDMYDLIIYGSVLPVLMKEWSMSPVQAGAIGSYGLAGMMVGAVLFGILADRFGRRKVLTLSVALFSIATVACGFAPGPVVFSVFRFLAGLGIGGILPSVIAIVTDYSPRKLTNTLVGIVMCAFSVGGILAAVVCIFFIPAFGWQSVYWVAVIPLVLLPFMLKYFLESPAVLVARKRFDDLRWALARANPAVELPTDAELGAMVSRDGTPGVPQRAKPESRVRALFTGNRALGTLMIWVAFFMCLLMVNGISTWLPNLMVEAGYPLGSSLTFMIVLNTGAIIGTLLLGRLADTLGVKKVLVPMFVIAAVSLSLLGFGSNMVVLFALVAIAGACTHGSQNISYAFVSQYYPSHMRSTAIGLASGVGRIGAIIGPTFGGILLTLDLPVQINFIFFAIPGLFAALAFAFVPLASRRHAPEGSDSRPAGDAAVVS